MDSLFPESILQRIEKCGVIAVLVIDQPEDVVPLARALLACGIDAMELTLRTPAAVDALRLVRKQVPEMLAGVGTILSTPQLEEVIDAGAAFGVAPGLNVKIVERAKELGLPFAPGIVTPSEIELAVELGCRELKFFPAEPSGGIKYLRSMYAPYAHLGLQFLPLGGINAANMAAYLFDAAVPAIGGSWLAPRKMIQERNWSGVIDHATEARRVIKELRKK
ncbi:MAG: bifunctional 4-hydroxy-2-oxoglutarate aldolase/2-dehydro-3-deoxy-phosphogluconate aldolase [Rubripirellula sp.]|nr:keto-deoxy-phosphogluconate aldolase [Rhodopirellula sp.]MCH1441060.1 bifunctional 4-hydroxy-2-oxoglutarate aldolase/2-dehydro-3-deoxy-phosphogluconate aldolase [Rubripirellula sp.]OUX03929.1 MAG: keto-deoxy-phosphogluconate aldolase [Planctomycetaceae bacterium TMED240]